MDKGGAKAERGYPGPTRGFEKVPTGDACWPAQWPAVRVRALACALACGTTAARANRALACGRGP